ncbi:MAG TPA: response regulator transcription factor [Rhodospirillaceae bacterium]|nr:response regulator transcription factor [Rhodospirillaceae bacterium]
MKILIADDHELFRDGLRHVLLQMDPAINVIEAADYPQLLAIAETETDIKIVLLDLSMPGMRWEDGLPLLRQTIPEVPIIVLSAADERRQVLMAVNLGAAGFIPKTSNSRVTLSALKLVLSGGIYLPPALLDQWVEHSLPQKNKLVGQGGPPHLTPRQEQVLELLSRGSTNKEIAQTLDLAEGTVKLHVTAILKALNVNNRTHAVVAASRLDLVSKDPPE